MLPAWLMRLRNAFDYPLRQLFRWRRGGLTLRPAATPDTFEDLPPQRRAAAEARSAALFKAYHLESFRRSASARLYRENLFYLDMLETALERAGAALPDPLQAVDIGPSSWFYVQGEYALLRWWRAPQGRNLALTAYEADAFRVFNNLHSRYDYAQAYCRGLEGATYLPQAFQAQPGRYDLALMLFPFVFEQDHLEWGLPTGLFDPDVLHQAAWDSLKPGGTLIIVNQGEAEHRAELARLERMGAPVAAAFQQDDLLFTYDLPRFVLVSRRGI